MYWEIMHLMPLTKTQAARKRREFKTNTELKLAKTIIPKLRAIHTIRATTPEECQQIALTGQVLAVGGIREKVIAARRARITEVILPFANKGDYEALPEYLREGITVHFVRSFREVFDIVFEASAEQKQLH